LESQISLSLGQTDFNRHLDALSGWRAALCDQLEDLLAYLVEHDLAEISARDGLVNIKQRLAHQKLVIAFVAEFSRGKSELINAIFFSDAGKRVLPAAPGRTTMCPVELSYEPAEPPALALLPSKPAWVRSR
jgi:hypothetical protein